MNNLDQNLPPIRPSLGSGHALAIFTAVVALAGGCGRSGSSSSGGGGGGGAGSGSVSYSQYNTLTGTFVAPGINVKLAGSMLGGFNMGSSGTHPQTGWNAGGPFAPTFAAGALRTGVTITGEIPAGTKPEVSLSLLTVGPARSSHLLVHEGQSRRLAAHDLLFAPLGGRVARLELQPSYLLHVHPRGADERGEQRLLRAWLAERDAGVAIPAGPAGRQGQPRHALGHLVARSA